MPDRPFLLVGQMGAADATRVPAGGEALWAYTHVPQRVRGDAPRVDPASARCAARTRATWTPWPSGSRRASRAARPASATASPPGGSSARTKLEALDGNLVGGAINGGTAGLHQQLSSDRSPDPDAPRRRSRASTSRPRRPIPAAACTARAERMPHGLPCGTTRSNSLGGAREHDDPHDPRQSRRGVRRPRRRVELQPVGRRRLARP